ncbi:MAG: glycosyltransferase family 2 protein [Phycisphaerales bacterium]
MSRTYIVIPVYNEAPTIDLALDRVERAVGANRLTAHLILVDDASTDETRAQLEARRFETEVTILRHEVNRGKGAALRSGIDAVLADPAMTLDDIVLVQDADLEYDPADYPALLAPFQDATVRVVYGARFGAHRESRRFVERLHAWGNRCLTELSNLATGYDLADMECGYKLIRVDALRRVRPQLSEDRFGVEPQLTAALARLGERIVEAPIRYTPRSFNEGKKIKWLDGVRAVWVIFREWARGHEVLSE